MNKYELRKIIENHIKDGLIEEAELKIEQYKEIFDYDDELASMEAIIKIYRNKINEAMECIREGLKYNIFNGDLYFTMGNVYEIMEEYNRAYLCYEHALESVISDDNYKIVKKSIENLKENYNINVNNFSIIILTYNNLDFTKICIDSVRKYNRYADYEIIVVDNNSTDGTVEWIKNQKDIKYILNKENKGFPTGCNQGIEIAEKNNDIFLLNNDTVIMPNSIYNLRMGLYSNKNIGATGAVSNQVPYYQKIKEKFEDFDGYMDFALKNNISNETLYENRIKLIGFAMFIKRDVLNKVGNLDERFTPGNYEDDDISFRILLAGYKLLLCKDSYIHHFGSVSFSQKPDKYEKLLKLNSNKFKQKWGFVSEYSTFIRNDLINMVNDDKNRNINILEIGCACGATLLKIKSMYPNSKLYGVEIDGDAAQIASSFADIIVDDIENSNLDYQYNFFDYIIIGNVFEQLINPTKVLKDLGKYLKNDGYILLSIPNVMNYNIIRELLKGNWHYKDSGLLDKRSIRFFTKKEIENMFSNCNYKINDIYYSVGFIDDKDKEFIEKISSFSGVNKEEFQTEQYLIKAQKKLD